MPAERDLRATTDRIEALLGELTQSADEPVRARAAELVRLLMEMYGAGLARLMEIVATSDGGGADALLARLGADPQVSGLLLVHGLHPVDLRTRIERALDSVRPALASHGGDVALLACEAGVVRLRLLGTCNGCPSSTVTMKLAVERAIADAAPDVAGIEVEGAADPSAAPPDKSAAHAALPDTRLVTLGSGAAATPIPCPAAPPAAPDLGA